MKNSTQVLIHSPANFPYVRERGFLVGLGQEVNVQVDATGKSRYFGLLYLKFNANSNHYSDEISIFIIYILDVFSTYSTRGVDPNKRNCLFYDEREMGFYENYTRSNCQMECSLRYTRFRCGCQPYFYPCMFKNIIKPVAFNARCFMA